MIKDYWAHNLFIPIETKARELDSKLLLSLFAIRRGYRVFFGQHGELYDLLKSTPKSIIVEHSIAGSNGAHYQRLRERGHRIVAWDEEGFLPIEPEYYVDRRIGQAGLENVEWHFTWGPAQEAWISKRFPALADKVAAVGNPRLDILRPEFRDFYAPEAAGYRARFGDYVLFCSSFSRANIHHGDVEAFIRSVVADAGLSPEREAFYREWIAFSREIMERFLVLIPRLSAALPDVTFVIRPHPSENFQLWRDCASGLRNVHVVYEGSAAAWIHGAAAVLHNSCTTAVEAALMERPVIAYCPLRSKSYEVGPPNNVSTIAADDETVVATLRQVLARAKVNRAPSLPDSLARIGDVLTDFAGPLASEAALDRIDTVSVARERVRGYLRKKKNRILLPWRKRGVVEPVRAQRVQKFDGLTLCELDEKLGRLCALRPTLGPYRLRHVYKTCYSLVAA